MQKTLFRSEERSLLSAQVPSEIELSIPLCYDSTT